MKIRRYPWDRWFAQGKFKLVRGRHYDIKSYGMAGNARNAARDRGYRLHIEIAEDEKSMVITVIKDGKEVGDVQAS